ncbi:MAG: 50S ribosomal protein L21e [Candidatus Nanoarchaeia archaeon]
MVQRIGGSRRKTRDKFKKDYRSKGKISIRDYMQKLESGDRVRLRAESSLQEGIYPPKYHGKIGLVKAQKGWCYEVDIKDGGKEKTLVVHPAHLKKV